MSTVFEIVTDRLIKLMKEGIIPWNRPWNSSSGRPTNIVSKKPYRGINVFLLSSIPFNSRWWMTYEQAINLRGHVKKGEKGSLVVFWKMLQKLEKDSEGNERLEKIPMLRYYTVFNLEQVEGVKAPQEGEVKENIFTPIEKAEEIVRNMPKRPEIKQGGNKAFYSPGLDYVRMPEQKQFPMPEEYYCTLFHELVHSTGHSSRANRKLDGKLAGFGSPDYSREELVAEMGAAFLCAEAGIESAIIQNSAAYIQSWIRVLKGDSKLAVIASAQATKAANYILGQTHEEEQVDPVSETVGQCQIC